jgi:hypothetical protein
MSISSQKINLVKPVIGIVLVLLIAVFTGLAFIRFGTEEYKLGGKANPLNVKVELASNTASQELAVQGGTMQYDVFDDEAIALTLAKDSIFDAKEISITKINSIHGMPRGWKLISGVQLGPNGMQLANQGALEISIPGDLNPDQLVGFTYGDNGEDFSLYPVQIVNNKATLALDGLSGCGVLSVDNFNQSLPKPSLIQRQAYQNIALIEKRNVSKSKDNDENSIDQGQLNQTAGVLKEWFAISIKKKLALAARPGIKDDTQTVDNTDAIKSAAFEYLSWMQTVQSLGLDQKFVAQNDTALGSLASAIKSNADNAVEKCISENDMTQIDKLQHLYKFSIILGLNNREGLNIESIRTRMKRLASFELRINELIHVKTHQFGDDVFNAELIGAGNIPLSLDDDFTISGSGIMGLNKVNSRINFPAGTDPVAIISALMGTAAFDVTETANGNYIKAVNEKYNVSIQPFTLDSSLGSENASVIIVPSPGNSSSWLWQEVFRKSHVTELDNSLPGKARYRITNWSIPKKAGAYALRSYSRNTQFGNLDVREDTTFSLIFKPSK